MPRKGGVPENLKPCKPGETHNPNGRPPILPGLKEALEKVLTEQKDGMTGLEAVFVALRTKAIRGDIRAIQEVLDRYYGKVKQDVNLTNAGEKFEPIDYSKLDESIIRAIVAASEPKKAKD
jgi:Family of unknown function (DUF5681)